MRPILLSLLFAAGLALSLTHVFAQDISSGSALVTDGPFINKKYRLKGQWSIERKDGRDIIRFSEDFKTKNGPDLKVVLSPNTVGQATGKTALTGGYKLGVLKSNRGEQAYVLPEGVSLSDYKSVLVQCEAFSVLWGGFDIPE